MEIKDVFGAYPKSVWEFMCENGQGFYIPAYQRQYSWDESKITTLIEDACHGFNLLIKKEDAITFIGTVIAIHDTTFSTVQPHVKGEVPSKVMTIIDGQQRMTTLLLLNTALHEEIRIRLNKIKKQKNEAAMWLEEECLKVAGKISKTYEENKDYGEDAFQYYPRMIRAYDDSWSRKKSQATYKSPIGFFLHEYGKYARSNPTSNFLYEDRPKDASHEFMFKSRKILLGLIKKILKGDEDLDFPSFEDILASRNLQTTLINSEFPDYVSKYIVSESNPEFKELLRLVLFANFILDRVALTIVTAKNEDYAFDMFESLNTTGEPLTAFETFKPRVIFIETLDRFQSSPLFGPMKHIENYLEGFVKSVKQDATSKLIVSFALAESGEKISKRLRDQRGFLRDSYELETSNPEVYRNNFIQLLSETALFCEEIWPDDKKKIPNLVFTSGQKDETALLCIDFLRKFNHTITIPALVRFYSYMKSNNCENKVQAEVDLFAAIKAIAAFSILWRGSRKNTGGIDNIYRKIMSEGYPACNFSPLSRYANGIEQPAPDVKKLKETLRSYLKVQGEVNDKDDWVRIASKLPLYSVNQDLTRFLLLAAAHNSVPDTNDPGLIVAGKNSILPLLNINTWRDDTIQTVEHIAPDKKSPEWNEKIYEEKDEIHRLGNLTLLPIAENASLSNSGWNRKRFIYKILSAETEDELDELLNKAKTESVSISQTAEDLLTNSKYLPLVKSIAKVEEDWSHEMIDKRSIRLADLAWDRIYPWLLD